MERHYVYQTNKGLAYFLIGFGVLMGGVALGILIKSMLPRFGDEAFEWTSLLYFIQALSLVVLGIFNLRFRKYYIEWSAEEINYFLTGKKRVEKIRIADIESLVIKLFEIQIKLKDEEKIINLENLQFKSIRSIKDKFEEISSSLT